MVTKVENNAMKTLALGERVAHSADDIAEVILAESDKHVEGKVAEAKKKGGGAFDNPDVRFEFQLGCDALNSP